MAKLTQKKLLLLSVGGVVGVLLLGVLTIVAIHLATRFAIDYAQVPALPEVPKGTSSGR